MGAVHAAPVVPVRADGTVEAEVTPKTSAEKEEPASGSAEAPVSAYDPMALRPGEVTFEDLTLTDAARNGREVPIRVWLPAGAKGASEPLPIVLFSHGLGGSRENNGYYARHLTGRGYVAVFIQHPGSDESVWRDVPVRERMQAMNQAASSLNFGLRVGDVKFVVDSLEEWNLDAEHPLHGKLNLDKIAMSGHSFGAVTSQAVIGQNFGVLGAGFEEPRLKAAILMSPSMPERGTPEETFGTIEKPVLCLTGTDDNTMISQRIHVTPENRLLPYKGLPATGNHYQLVLFEANHMAFSDRQLRGGPQRNPEHHPRILAASTAFLDAYLLENPEAEAWLKAEKGGFGAMLAPEDRWEFK